MAVRDQELELYRGLMEAPKEYAEGFTKRSIIGAFFVGFIMMPGSIYLGLLAGQGLGPAAEWVTIILFTEAARRSFTVLRRQEIYILYYMAGALTGGIGLVALSGGPFAGLIWNQYLVQSDAALGFGIRDQIPYWVVPSADSPALVERTFFHAHWFVPILLLIVGNILGRLNWFGLGYVLFRITSDVERLPFPMAPIAAQAATALAEVTAKTEGWRWHVFSIGAVIGIAFGLPYVGIPAFTGSVLTRPVQLIPIPFYDMTLRLERTFPGVPFALSTDLGAAIVGFVLPFWVVIGSALATLASLIVNPWLARNQLMPTWSPGMDYIQTSFATSVDFWTSFGIGTSAAVAIIGIVSIARSASRMKRETSGRGTFLPPPGRGDFPIWIGIALFAASTLTYILLCRLWLVPKFPLVFLVFFGFIQSPVESYINARMIGLTGQYIGIPMVREASFILSRYKGVDIWFAPIPMSNHGGQAQNLRVVELTGTKITSIIKAELFMLPLILICSLCFWQYMWKLAPIPSTAYPYAQKMWHLQALRSCLWMTATAQNNEMFMRAINWKYIVAGGASALGSYGVLSVLQLPVMLVWGFVRGLGGNPMDAIPQLFGALLSQFYFVRRYGMREWKQYAAVLVAGYACGMGLIGMGSAAIAMVMKSIRQLPY